MLHPYLRHMWSFTNVIPSKALFLKAVRGIWNYEVENIKGMLFMYVTCPIMKYRAGMWTWTKRDANILQAVEVSTES